MPIPVRTERGPRPEPVRQAPLVVALRPPRPAEGPVLTELCLRSKAHWGYDEAFMQACRVELTIGPDASRASEMQVAELAAAVVGVAEVHLEDAEAILDKLFVEPAAVRQGVGRRLFDWARTAARDGGARILVIESDPNAAGFYRRMGATDDGAVPSGPVRGRFIPRLKLEL